MYEYSSSSVSESMISPEWEDILKRQNLRAQFRLEQFKELENKSQTVHAAFLFYRDSAGTDLIHKYCRDIFTGIVKRIGGTRESHLSPGWKSFASELGIKSIDIEYIDNSLKTPPTENVLQMFVQNDEATFDKIIQALFRMKRLDVIEEIYTPLSQMVDEIISNYNNETDQGYYSNSSKEKDFLLIKPLHIVNTLPEILKLPNENNGSFKPNDKIISQPSLSLPSLKKPAILITYFDDGKVAAEEILNEIRNMPLEYPVNALCLEDEKLLILSNPEQYIRHFYQEVNYVMPILTNGYMNIIKEPRQQCPSFIDNVDCVYARFLYTLMSTDYINGSGCLNRKVRAVVPKGSTVPSDLHLFTMFVTWSHQRDIDKLIKSMFKN